MGSLYRVSLMRFNTIITKTTNDGKVERFEIEVGLRDEMRRIIRDRIIQNLEATKRFLQLGEDYKDICAGIYTYAVEEYGKILFLNDLSPTSTNPNLPIQYKATGQGFLNHRHKIDLAWDALPDSCKLLSEGGFTDTGFTQSGFTHDTPAKLETRLSIFFVDFNKEDNFCSPMTPPQVRMDLLVTAVDDFLKFIRAKKYP
jgi:hypothetical protein